MYENVGDVCCNDKSEFDNSEGVRSKVIEFTY